MEGTLNTGNESTKSTVPKAEKAKLRCGLCEYFTPNMTEMACHMAAHTVSDHPFKCTQCGQTFPSYGGLQQHPCGDAQFVFLLQKDSPEGSAKQEHAVDLSITPVRSANIVYGPMEPERTEETEKEQEDGSPVKDEAGGKGQDDPPVQLSPMTLRTRRSLNYSDMVHNEQGGELHEEPAVRKVANKAVGSSHQENDPGSNLSAKNNAEKQRLGSARPANTKEMSCQYCTFKSVYPGNLKAHINRHLTPGRAHCVCTKCGLNFLTRRHLDSHKCQMKASANLAYLCKLCDFRSEIRANVTKHLHRHRCGTCHMYFQTINKRQRHSPRCNKEASSSDPRGQRLKNDRGELITFDRQAPSSLVEVKCMACRTTFLTTDEFHAHKCVRNKVVQKGAKPKKPVRIKMEGYDEDLMLYCCQYCEFSTPSALALKSHKKHSKTEKPLEKTPELQAKRLEFARAKEKLRKKPRMQGWDDEAMLYVCSICKFATPTPVALYNHKKYHDEKENSVDLSLDENIGSETQGENQSEQKDYSCLTCDFTTPRLWDLRAHEGLHSGERPLKCSKCNIGFADQFHLNIHQMKLHAEVEKVEKVSKKRVKSPSVPEGNMDPCPQLGCNFTTKSAVSMNQHIRLHFAGLDTARHKNDQVAKGGEGSVSQGVDHYAAGIYEVENVSRTVTVEDDSEPQRLSSNSASEQLSSGISILRQRDQTVSAINNKDNVNGTSSCQGQNNNIVKEANVANVIEEPVLGSRDSALYYREENGMREAVQEIVCHETSPLLDEGGSQSTKKRRQSDDNKVEPSKENNKIFRQFTEITEKACEKDRPENKIKSSFKQVKIAEDQNELIGRDSPWVPIEQAPSVDPLSTPAVIKPGFDHGDELRQSPNVSGEVNPPPAQPEGDLTTGGDKEALRTEDVTMTNTDEADGTQTDQEPTEMPPLSPIAARPSDGANSVLQQRQQYQWRRRGWPNQWRAQPAHQVQLVELRTTTTTATAAPATAVGAADHPASPRFDGQDRANSNLVVPVPVRAVAAPAVAGPPVAADRPSHSSEVSAVRSPRVGEGSLHRCSFCKVYFEDFRLFLHHLGMHQPENPWRCTYCWRNFNNVFAFTDHH